jgi:hypothetical protein
MLYIHTSNAVHANAATHVTCYTYAHQTGSNGDDDEDDMTQITQTGTTAAATGGGAAAKTGAAGAAAGVRELVYCTYLNMRKLVSTLLRFLAA